MSGRVRNRSVLVGLIFQIVSQLQSQPYHLPVTIAVIFINIFVHYGDPYTPLLCFGYDLHNIYENCIKPDTIVWAFRYRRQILFNRLIFPAIIHADDMHLYYNMLSFTWKGIHLESKMGSMPFFLLLLYSLVVSHCLLIGLSFALHSSGVESHVSGYNTCAVGFSAVIFSLKYVLNQSQSTLSPSSSPTTRVHGLEVPLGYACWVELVIISLVTPNASFLGHLSGILAGMIFLNGRKYLLGMNRYFLGAVPSWRGRFTNVNGNSYTAAHTAEDYEEYEYYYEDDDDDYDDRYEYIPFDGSKSSITAAHPGMAGTNQSSHQPPLSREELRKQRVQRYEQKNDNRQRLRRKK